MKREGGELTACDDDRSRSYLHGSFVPHERTVGALDLGFRSNVRRVPEELRPYRYNEDPHPATTPTFLASIPETSGFIAADRARWRPRQIDHPTRAEFPESTGELCPCCWSAHSSPKGGIPPSLTHRVIQNHRQGEFDTKFVFPCFDGESHFEDYLDWERHVDDFFYYTGVPIERQVKYVVRKLTGRAGAWWSHLVQARRHEGRRDVKTWHKMKQLLREQFLSPFYENQPLRAGSKGNRKYGLSNDPPRSRVYNPIRQRNLKKKNIIDLSPHSEKKNKIIELHEDCFADSRDMANRCESFQDYIISEKIVKLSEHDKLDLESKEALIDPVGNQDFAIPCNNFDLHCPVSYKDANQQSPSSALEVPFEKKKFSTDCCKKINEDLHDRRIKPLLLMPELVNNDVEDMDSAPTAEEKQGEIQNVVAPSNDSLTKPVKKKDAQGVFDSIHNDIVVWIVMMYRYIEYECPYEALIFFEMMMASLKPNSNTLAKLDEFSGALKVFDGMPIQDAAARYAIAFQRIKDAERFQDCSDQISWTANEMASIHKEGDPSVIDLPITWAGLAMAHRVEHEIIATCESGQKELAEVEERAIYTLKQTIEEGPNDAVQWHQFGLHNLRVLQFNTSVRFLKAVVARCVECSYAWSNLGVALQLSDDPFLTEEVYKRALSLATAEQAHVILSNLGNLFRQQRRFEYAKILFAKSLEFCPGYALAHNNLGLVYVEQGLYFLDLMTTICSQHKKDEGLKKAPTISSIELHGIVYEFFIGDISHPQIKEVQILVAERKFGASNLSELTFPPKPGWRSTLLPDF